MGNDRKKWFEAASYLILAAALPLSLIFLRQAGGEGEGRLNLQELVQEALAENPEILAAKDGWDAAQSRPPQVRSLPDPQVSFGLRNIGTEITVGREDMSTVGGSVMQEIPFPGKLRLRGESAQREADREGFLYQATRFRVVSQLKVAYYDLYLTYKSLETIDKSKVLLEDIERAAEARYATGMGIQQDVLRAQVEISRLIDRATIEEARKEALEATINALLNRSPRSPLGRPEKIEMPSSVGSSEGRVEKDASPGILKADAASSPSEQSRSLERPLVPWSLEELSNRVERSPQLRAGESTIAQRETSLDLARKEYLPDFSLNGAFYSRGDFRDMWEVMFTVSVPIYYKTKQDYGVREATSALRSSRRVYQANKQVLLARLRELHVEARAAERLANLFRQGIIPQATLSLESAMVGYQVGKVDFLTVLDNVVRLLEDELRYYEEVAKLEKALARIEEIIGAGEEG